MSGLIDIPSFSVSRHSVAVIALIAALVTAVILQAQALLTVSLGPIVIGPISVLVTVAGVLVGPIAVIGCVVGYLVHSAAYGFFPLLDASGHVALGLLVSLFWGGFKASESRNRTVYRFRAFLAAAVIASFAAATFVTWGYEVTGRFPFFPNVVFIGLGNTLSVLIGGSIAFAVLSILLNNRKWQSMLRAVNLDRYPRNVWESPEIRISAGFLFAWMLIGSVVSIGFQIVELVPPYHIRVRSLDLLLLLHESGPFDHGGATLHLGLGVTVISLWLISLRRYRTATAESGG